MALSPATGCAAGVVGGELLFGVGVQQFFSLSLLILTGTLITQHLPSSIQHLLQVQMRRSGSLCSWC